jgi:hypothetical protein
MMIVMMGVSTWRIIEEGREKGGEQVRSAPSPIAPLGSRCESTTTRCDDYYFCSQTVIARATRSDA